MTYHIFYHDHSCIKCEAQYIPYGTDVPCPNCGLVEDDERLPDLVEQMAMALDQNYLERGSYMPGAYSIMCLGDHVAFNAMRLMEYCRQNLEQRSCEASIEKQIQDSDWTDVPYMATYMHDLLLRVNEHMSTHRMGHYK